MLKTTALKRKGNDEGSAGVHRSAKEDTSPSIVNSVRKAFRVLELFDQTRKRLTLTQIASASGMDLSAAQRFTSTLMAMGLMSKDPDLRVYSLTPRLLELGYRYLQSSELVERAMPYLQRLASD